MTEKKSMASFFEKRVLRPSKQVNYALQELTLSPDRKPGRRNSQREVIMQENIKMQSSEDLTRQILTGKTVNPFFEKKIANVSVKTDVLEFMEPLLPNYVDCHVGHVYRKSDVDIFSAFPKKIDQSVNYDMGVFNLTLLDESVQSCKTQVTKISMTKMDLDEYLNSHFSQDVLQEPCIQAMYNKLLGSNFDAGLQWNDKYAPGCSEELLGCTNRIYASSLLAYIQEWKPEVAKKIRHIPKKQPKYHKLDDFDEFIISDVDSEFDGFRVSSKHQLIIGPPGSGKTALISAVAKEAGIGILEIHTGMKRSGKELISTLGETTSSRLVGGGKKGTIDPKWFQEKPAMPKKRRKRIVTDSTEEESEIEQDMISMDSETVKKPPKKNQKKNTSKESNKEITKPKVGITSFFKPIQKSHVKQPDKNNENKHNVVIDETDKKETAAKKSLESKPEKPKKGITSFFKPMPRAGSTSFFKPVEAPAKEQSSDVITVPDSPPPEKMIQIDHPPSSVSPPPRLHGTQRFEPSIDEPTAEEARSVSARKTVILLDCVDVITDQDKGFWNGVATLFETTRRPIILCCNENPLIANNSSIPSNILEFLSNAVETYQVSPPDEDELGVLMNPSLVKQICVENNYDIRQIILFLQISARKDRSLMPKEKECFHLYKIDSLPSLSSFKNESCQVWQQSIIPDSLDDAVVALDTISGSDHRLKSRFFSDSTAMASTNSSSSDCCSLFPILADDLLMPIQTAPRDIQLHLGICRRINRFVENSVKEHPVSNCEARALPFYDFPKWPFMGKQLDDTSNLLFWDGSIQVPRCFITEMLPWLSVLLQHSHLIAQRDGYSHQKGRTRRSNRKVLRLFENELSDEQFESISKPWF